MERSGLACFWMFLVILSMYGEAGLVRLRPLLFALCCRRSCQDSCQVTKNSEDIENLHFSKTAEAHFCPNVSNGVCLKSSALVSNLVSVWWMVSIT